MLFVKSIVSTASLSVLLLVLSMSFVWADTTETSKDTASVRNNPNYQLHIDMPSPQKNKGKVAISVKPKTGRKINLEFPVKLVVKVQPGILLPKTTLRKADAKKAVENGLEFELPYEFSTDFKGTPTIDVTFRFGTCEVKDGKVAMCFMHNEDFKLRLPHEEVTGADH